MQIKRVLQIHMLPVIVAICSVILLSQRLYIFPSANIETYTYSDGHEQSSTPNTLNGKNSRSFFFSYSFEAGKNNQYAGISFQPRKRISLVGWDYLFLDIKSSDISSYNIYMKAFIEGISNKNDPLSHAYFSAAVPVENKILKIPLKSFVIPSWWYSMHGSNTIEDSESKLKKNFTMLEWQNISNTAGSLAVEEIYFTRNRKMIFISASLFLVFWYAGYIVIRHLTGKKYTKVNFQSDGSLKLRMPQTEELKLIADYIGKNYSDPQISLSSVCSYFHRSPSWLLRQLKKHFGLTFSRYINAIRIHEAERLLETTALNISEIACALGYNDRSTFSRVFSDINGKSPRNYRKSFIQENSNKT